MGAFNVYARFRGYAFFDSDTTSLLPWNTTKTGVDADSPTFRSVRLDMLSMTRPVITFLNQLDAERGEMDTDHNPLDDAVENSVPITISDVIPRSVFISPRPAPKPTLPRTGRIQYNKPSNQIEIAKKALKVSSYVRVGERTFEYFFERECEE